MGSTRVLSATRLTRVDPSAPANVHRLQNAVVGLVVVSDADKREDLQTGQNGADGVKQEDTIDNAPEEFTKQESEAPVKTEENGGSVKEEEDTGEADVEEDEEEDGEPIWKEEIGWREVCGFLTM